MDELLTYCEPIYQRITGFFHSYPKKVPVIIRGRIDAANGFTSFLPQRIELYLTAPTDHFLGARTESWLKILLTHELTHFVHASMDKGFFFALSHLFGSELSAASVFFLPGWMIEGPSTNLETRFTDGGRGRNPLFEMYWKAPVEEGKLFSLEQGAYGSAFPPPGRIYVSGYILVDSLLTTYGEDTFRRIMEEYLGFPFFGPWAAISKVTGKNASQIFADLKKHLEQKYAGSLSIASGTRITPQRPGDWVHPQPTDRGLYVYRSSPERFSALVRYEPADGSERILHPVVDDTFSFSATKDGRTIYLTSMKQTWVDPNDPQLISDLYRLDADTGSLHRITSGAHLWQPAVSSDGQTLIAVQGVGPYSRLVSVDERSGSLRVLFSRSEGNVYTPVFSPDGRRVAFTVNLRGFQDVSVAEYDELARGSTALDDPRLPVADVSVKAAHPILGPDAFGEYFPSFLDDGSLVFSSDREGSLALYRADLGSGEVAKIQDDPVAAISAVRDGDALLSSSYSADGWSLLRTPIADLTPVPLASEKNAAQEYPPPVEWTGGTAAAKPYVDWPAPLMWLPFPALTRTGPGSPGVELGLGAIVYGASLLGTTTWLADAAWSFASEQPLAAFTVSTVIGPFTLSADSSLSYEYSSDYTESVVSSLQLGLPLFNEIAFDSQRLFSLSLGLAHRAMIESLAPFTFAQALGSMAGSWQNTLFLTSGISFQWQRNGGQIDFTPPLAVQAQLQSSTVLPVLDSSVPESDFLLQLGLNIPSVIPHQVVRLGLKASDVLGGPFSSYTDSFSVPRGFPGPSTRGVPGQALASIDYLVPIALLDQPLLFSLAARGAAFGVHVEGIGRWDNAAAISLDPSLYVGGDVSLLMAFNAVPFAVVLGVAARIDTAAPGSFDPGRDLGIYLTIGQQAGSTGQGAQPLGPRRLLRRRREASGGTEAARALAVYHVPVDCDPDVSRDFFQVLVRVVEQGRIRQLGPRAGLLDTDPLVMAAGDLPRDLSSRVEHLDRAIAGAHVGARRAFDLDEEARPADTGNGAGSADHELLAFRAD